MTKSGAYKTVAAIILVGCLASNVRTHFALIKTRSLVDTCVSVENYNQLVRAETNNVGRLAKILQDDRAQLQQFAGSLRQLATVTNLYEKTGEVEGKLDAVSAGYDGIKTSVQKQADSAANMNLKLGALERAVIKLSLAVQESQFGSQITVLTSAATNAATNAVSTTNTHGVQ